LDLLACAVICELDAPFNLGCLPSAFVQQTIFPRAFVWWITVAPWRSGGGKYLNIFETFCNWSGAADSKTVCITWPLNTSSLFLSYK
jgi:hypothetical protein